MKRSLPFVLLFIFLCGPLRPLHCYLEESRRVARIFLTTDDADFTDEVREV